jgi:hypothetical protein
MYSAALTGAQLASGSLYLGSLGLAASAAARPSPAERCAPA